MALKHYITCLLSIMLFCLLVVLSPYSYWDINYNSFLSGPFGRNILVLISYAVVYSFSLAVAISLLSIIFVFTMSFFSVFSYKALSGGLQILYEVIVVIPYILIIILLLNFFKMHFSTLVFVVALLNSFFLFPYVKERFNSIKNTVYIQNALNIKLNYFCLLWFYVLPNTYKYLLGLITYTLVGNLTTFTGLEFLGLYTGSNFYYPTLGGLMLLGLQYFYSSQLFIISMGTYIVFVYLILKISSKLSDKES